MNKDKKIKFSHCSKCNPLGQVDYCICPERQEDGSWKEIPTTTKNKIDIVQFTDKEFKKLLNKGLMTPLTQEDFIIKVIPNGVGWSIYYER
jgi:hypothetical protein